MDFMLGGLFAKIRTVFQTDDNADIEAYRARQEALKKRSLSEVISSRYSPEDAQQVGFILDALQVRHPQPGEFFAGRESILIRKDGIVLRIGQHLKTEEHDLVLEPWKKISLHKCVFEVMPVVPSYPEEHYAEDDPEAADMLKASGILYKDGMDPHDLHDGFAGSIVAQNFGMLPAYAPPFKGRIPVARDRGAVGGWAERDVPLKGKFREAAYNGIQKKVYGKFIDLLNNAWPEGESLPTDKEAVHAFWTACKEEISRFREGHETVLCEDYGASSAEFSAAAEKYERVL